jgi:hypothetical protein
MEIWARTKNLVFVVATMCLYFTSTKEVIIVQGVWNSPSMVTTMVNGQAFHHNLTTPQRDDIPYSSSMVYAEQLCRLNPDNLYKYPAKWLE